MRRSFLLWLLFVLAACTGPDTGGATLTGLSTTTTAAGATANTVTEAPTTIPPAGRPAADGCFEGDAPFAADGFLGRFDVAGTDAQTISGISWAGGADCAAVTLTFRSSQGAPAADPPGVRAELLRHAAVLRLTFAGRLDSVYSAQRIETALVAAAYVVWDADADATVVDLHLDAAGEARVRTLAAPARVIVELRSASAPFTGRAQVGEETVVLPPPRDVSPVTIEFYGPAGNTIGASSVTNGASENLRIPLPESPTQWALGRWTLGDLSPGPVRVTVGDAPAIEFTAR